MAKFDKKIIARNLRKKGKSIIFIAKQLKVSKSSVSMWCRDITLSSEQIEILKKQKGSVMGRWMGAESNRRKKLEAIDKNKKVAFTLINKVSGRDLLIAGMSLFWGEGSKTGSRFIFINSDPEMLKIMKSFLVKILNVKIDDLRITIQINHVHKNRIKDISLFWSKYLGLPLESFSNPYYINTIPKKVYDNFDNYNGIVRLRVLRSSNLQYKMLGLIDAFKHYFKSM